MDWLQSLVWMPSAIGRQTLICNRIMLAISKYIISINYGFPKLSYTMIVLVKLCTCYMLYNRVSIEIE